MLKKSLRRDERGLEGMPLQLLIISIVLALAVPTIYSSVEYYDTRRTLKTLKSEIRFIGEKAEQVFVHGNGNSEVIEIDLSDGIFEKINTVKLCEDPDYVIKWETIDYRGQYSIPKRVPLYNGSGTISLLEGSHKIRMTCKYGNPSDPDGSGLYFDQDSQYIEIEVLR
ncbi:MAG: hypothetical protein ACOCSL_02445 [Thermoplasmatota archaeon]